QLEQRSLSQEPSLQREAAQAIPEEVVASNPVPPELPKAEPYPPYPGGSASPIVSRGSSVEEEDRHASRPMVSARSYGAEGRRLTAKDDADIPQVADVAKTSRTEYAGPLAQAASPAAASPEASRGSPGTSRDTIDPGDGLGRGARRRQSSISNRPT